MKEKIVRFVKDWGKWSWSLLGKWWALVPIAIVGAHLKGLIALPLVGGSLLILLAVERRDLLKSFWTSTKDYLTAWWSYRPNALVPAFQKKAKTRRKTIRNKATK